MSDIEQKTDDWFALRCGKFTGTTFKNLLVENKKSKEYQNLIWSVATERIQGYQPQGVNSYSLRWGTENEPRARDAYQIRTGEFVDEVAFIQHPKYSFVGVSPDGLIDPNGGLEIKCPKSPEIHLQRFFDGVPDEYMPQIQGAMWVTGRAWWDFVSYDPDTAEHLKLLIIRVNRDESFIQRIEKEVFIAENKVRELVDKFKQENIKELLENLMKETS